MSTDNIKLYLQANYSDEKLAQLIEHTESGKLSYTSCCCLVGLPTAPHALLAAGGYCDAEESHFFEGLGKPFGELAEWEFNTLGGDASSDMLRRERLLPILYEEVNRREQSRAEDYRDETPYWTDNDAMMEMVRDKGAK